MSGYLVWLVVGLGILGAEFATGTLYLLAISAGFFGGAITAWLGYDLTWQGVVAFVVMLLSSLAVSAFRKTRPHAPRMDHLDLGQSVQLLDATPGALRVQFRGAPWQAQTAGPDTDLNQALYIQSIQANILIVSNHKP